MVTSQESHVMHTALRPSRKQNKDESSLRASSLRGERRRAEALWGGW